MKRRIPRYAKQKTTRDSQVSTLQTYDTINATRPRSPIAIQLLRSALSAPLSFATLAVPVAPPCTTTPVAVQLVPQA